MAKSTGGGAEKTPDNNKRLAMLEAGVSALAMAMAANGIELKEGQDPIEQSIAIVKRWREQMLAIAELKATLAVAGIVELTETDDPCAAAVVTIDKLKAALVELDAQIAKGPETPEGGDQALIAAAERASRAESRVKELEDEVAELEIDVADAINEKNRLANLLAEEGKGTSPTVSEAAAEPAAPAPVRERPEGARDVGPTFGSLTADEIAQAIDAGGAFEIAFSNGEFELVEFGPIKIAGDQLHRFATNQFAVAPVIHVKGATAPESIHGAGLLLGDSQVGYCAFDPAVRIEPGQERAFNRALIFG
jgi:hypothetical protein